MTPDQEKELQKAAEGYAEDDRGQEEIWSVYKLVREAFIAGAKHQDAISRRDEREKVLQEVLDATHIGYEPHHEAESPEWWIAVGYNRAFDKVFKLAKQLETGESK